MDELTVITDYIQDQIGVDAEMIFGHGSDAQLKDSIRVTIIATGFEEEKTAEAPPAPRLATQGPQTSLFGNTDAYATTAKTGPKQPRQASRRATPSSVVNEQASIAANSRQQTQASFDATTGKKMPLSEEKIKEWLEVPAYLRRDISLTPSGASEQDVIRHQLEEDEDNATQQEQ